MEATIRNLKNLPGFTAPDDKTARRLLAQARAHVERCGIPEAHADFAELQTLWAAHLWSNRDGKNLKSQGIGDVRLSFGEKNEKQSYKKRFQELKTQVQGIAWRF